MSSGQGDNNPNKQEKSSVTKSAISNNKDDPQTTPRIAKTEYPESPTKNDKSKTDKDDTYPRRNFWVQVGLLIVTTLTFIAVAVYAFFAYCQLEETKSFSEQSEKMARKQNRAYVYAKPLNLYNLHTTASVQSYTMIGNSGNTFAINVKRFAGMRVLEPPGTDKIDDLSSMMIPEEGVMVMSPKVRMDNVPIVKELPHKRILTAKEIEAIKEGRKRIYVFGKITYEDVFGDKHISGFSHMYYGVELMKFQTGDGYADFQAKYCDKHNYAD